MEKNYMGPDAIVNFEFIEEQSQLNHCHDNPEILFVLEGELTAQTDMQTYKLSNEDFVLINSNRLHSYKAEKQLFAVRFQISMKKLTEILHRKSVIFWCSSIDQESPHIQELRKLLKDILFYNIGQGEKDAFYMNSLYYQLLGLLCGSFLLEDKETDKSDGGSEEERMSKILAYIRENYRQPISLQDVADELFLSTAYLSKYVKKQSDMGFVDLINSIRLSYAMEDLMYTDKPIIRVAMDNGFASVGALNKVFKEYYQSTPSKYRKDKKDSLVNPYYMEKAAEYLHNHMDDKSPVSVEDHGEMVLEDIKGNPLGLTQLLNVGRAADLLRANIQRQILACKESMDIRYVRFWNIFVEEMYLDRMPEQGEINYNRLYNILDFLTENGLKPYIELRLRNHVIRATANKVLHDKNTKKPFEGYEEELRFYDDFFAHIRRRYGIGEVSTWRFNFPIENSVCFENNGINHRLMNDELWETYLDEFDLVAGTFRKYMPDGKIGGAGFPVQHFGRDKLIQLMKYWRMHTNFPDFITITSFPYQLVKEEGRWYEKRRTELDFVHDDVECVKSAMAASGFGHLPLHLVECNLTLSDRSYINDTLMRGAFFAHTITRIYNRVEVMGVWNAMDNYSDYVDSSRYLFGGSGMYTRSGVPKPAAYAFQFMDYLYKDCVTVENGCLISKNPHRHYKLLVHNLVNMNTAYYLKDEDQFSAMSIEQMIETNEHKRIRFKIKNLEATGWQIRMRSINSQSGSVLNEWLNLNIEKEISRPEQKYLERISVPRIRVEKKNTFNGELEFDIDLEPNEVKYIHITELD